MTRHDSALYRILHALHSRFLLLVVASFLAAALAPSFGLWLWSATVIRTGPGEAGRLLTLPSLLLALLLLNAGLGVKVSQLGDLFRRPLLLGLGFAANLAVPVVFVVLLQAVASRCLPDACPALVAGFALLAAMPVAASSTVWAQKSNSDPALSLGLVACSTCLSPLTTPAALALIDWVTGGTAGAALARLSGSGPYLAAFVMAPSATGVLLRWLIGEARLANLKPWFQAGSMVVLLTLSYLNSSFVLPGLIAHPDWGFLGAVLAASGALCAFAFASGWAIAAAVGAGRGARRSLMFGLGMMNSGTGLTLAGSVLAHLPGALLPVIVYKLTQHLGAGIADRLLGRDEPTAEPARPHRRTPAPATRRFPRTDTVLCPG